MSTTITWTLNEIFKNYDEYKEFTKDIELYDDTKSDLELFNKWCFNALIYRFNHQNINYGNPEIFLTEFANVLINHFNQYYKQKQLIDSIYKFDLDEFSRVRETINSIAYSNNAELIDPSKWAGYVSQQNYTNDQLSKIDGYLKGIQQMPSYDRDIFTNKFAYMFQQFHSPIDYYYPKKGKYGK